MSKNDLQLLYLVVTRDGRKWLVAQSTKEKVLVCNDNDIWISIDDYNSDLTIENAPHLDIMKVYSCSRYASCSLHCDRCDRDLIWEREEVKEMTLEQVEKELGYKIKIVGGK